MFYTILSAIVIFILVLVGLPFLLSVIAPVKKEKNQKENVIFVKIWKIAAILLLLLGLAFLGGSWLAYLQGVVSQITILAAVGVVCLLASVICFIAGKHKK